MHTKALFSTLALMLSLSGTIAAAENNGHNMEVRQNNNQNNNNQNNNNKAELNPSIIAAASDSAGGASAEKGQSDSLTDPANFINFCVGKTITNGTQIKGGSCNPIVMGDIPANSKMISTVILSPKFGEDLQPNTDFNVQLQVANLQAGKFTNPDTTYYSAPQQLSGGVIVGHNHVTIQDMGQDLNPQQPLDPQVFVFFKGLNDAGNGNGLLSTTVTGGLKAGNYRVCTLSSAANHQPPLMPVAQRGAQDDCQKFTVGQGTGNQQNNNGGNNNNNAAAANNSAAQNNGQQNAAQQNAAQQNNGQQNAAQQNAAQQNNGQQNNGQQNANRNANQNQQKQGQQRQKQGQNKNGQGQQQRKDGRRGRRGRFHRRDTFSSRPLLA